MAGERGIGLEQLGDWPFAPIRSLVDDIGAAREAARQAFCSANLKPAKDKSTERIDGIVAAIMAIGRAMVAQDEPQPEYSLFFV
jgi:hypothetical protein